MNAKQNRRMPQKCLIIGAAVATLCLFFLQVVYAGVISNVWYIVNLFFWVGSVLAMAQYQKHKKRLWYTLPCFIGLVLVMFYVKGTPQYSFKDAVDIICENHIELESVPVRHSRKYWHLVIDDSESPHKDYLVIFEKKPLLAFYFDPYDGSFGPFDIESRFPYIQ